MTFGQGKRLPVMPGDIRTGFTKARQKSHTMEIYKQFARSVA